MSDIYVEIETSDGGILLFLEAGFHEALKGVVAVESESVVRVVNRIGFPVNLTAGAK